VIGMQEKDREEMRRVHRLHAVLRQPRESALLTRMQRMAGIGGWELDLLTQSLTWTSETYRIHEVTPACYVPTLDSALDFYVAEHVPLVRKAIAQAVQFGVPFDLELEMITGRGRRLWVRASGQVQRRGDQLRRVYGIIQEITERRRLEREILDIARYDQDRTVSGLRDELGQALTGVSLMLRCLAKRVHGDVPGLSSDIEPIISLVNRAIGQCRSLAKGLAPVCAHHGGLMTALRELAEAYGQSRGISVTVRQRGALESAIGHSTTEQIFGIVQGAMLLVAEHGGSSRLSVCVGARSENLIVSVSGDSPASDVEKSRVAQDLGMLRRRAKLLGASLQIMPLPRGGMRVRCILHASQKSRPQIPSRASGPP
jgi:signal transduction histidine kinase